MITAAFIAPHSPILIPAVGKANTDRLAETVTAYKKIAAGTKAVVVERQRDFYALTIRGNYVEGIHKEYHMPKPILKHKVWVLHNVPVEDLKTPEYVHQDDPYRRVIDIDWDHVESIHPEDIKRRPVVADDNGWVLDGNHRVTAARARGYETIPALVPYNK